MELVLYGLKIEQLRFYRRSSAHNAFYIFFNIYCDIKRNTLNSTIF